MKIGTCTWQQRRSVGASSMSKTLQASSGGRNPIKSRWKKELADSCHWSRSSMSSSFRRSRMTEMRSEVAERPRKATRIDSIATVERVGLQCEIESCLSPFSGIIIKGTLFLYSQFIAYGKIMTTASISRAPCLPARPSCRHPWTSSGAPSRRPPCHRRWPRPRPRRRGRTRGLAAPAAPTERPTRRG